MGVLKSSESLRIVAVSQQVLRRGRNRMRRWINTIVGSLAHYIILQDRAAGDATRVPSDWKVTDVGEPICADLLEPNVAVGPPGPPATGCRYRSRKPAADPCAWRTRSETGSVSRHRAVAHFPRSHPLQRRELDHDPQLRLL